MGKQDQGHTLAEKSRAVQNRFADLISGLKDETSSSAISVAEATDPLERFILWSGNLGALREPTSKLSLEYRLSDAPEIRNQINRQLDYILEAIDDLTIIVQGKQENRDLTIDIDIDDDFIGLDNPNQEPSDEAHMNLELISESLKTLFRIGVLVRKATPDNRFNRALQSTKLSFPDTFDIDYVREKHSKLKPKEQAWLAKRLGKAIAKRRQFIKYCRDHKARLALDEEDAGQHDAERGSTVLQSSKATTLHPEKLPSTLAVEFDEEEDDAVSLLSASTMTDALSTLKLPRLIDLSKDGEPFECPICFTLQSIKREKSWRIHAFRDLKPYSCTIGGAECDSELFGDQDSWFEHELNYHRSQYACSLCSHEWLSSRSELRSHILNAHGQFTEHQLQSLEDAGRKFPLNFKAQSCPFCDDWCAALREKGKAGGQEFESQDQLVHASHFKRHVAAHLEQLAIFAIPRATEEGDGGNADSLDNSVSTIRFLSESAADDSEWDEWDSSPRSLRRPAGSVRSPRSHKSRRRSGTGHGQRENGHDPSDPPDDRGISSVVSEPRDDTKPALPHSSGKSKDSGKKHGGIFSLFNSNGNDEKRDSFLVNAGTLGAGAGLASAAAAVASALSRETPNEIQKERRERLEKFLQMRQSGEIQPPVMVEPERPQAPDPETTLAREVEDVVQDSAPIKRSKKINRRSRQPDNGKVSTLPSRFDEESTVSARPDNEGSRLSAPADNNSNWDE